MTRSLDSLRHKWHGLDAERVRRVIEIGRLEHEVERLRQQQERVERDMREHGRPVPTHCSVLNCARPVRALGMCSTHYSRSRQGVNVDAPVVHKPRRIGRKLVPISVKLRARVERLAMNPIRLGANVPRSEQGRNFECECYDACLEHAATRNWAAFTCVRCSGPGGR